MQFIYAKELKKEFVVLGSFYKLKYSNGKVIDCRNVLEIYKKSLYISIKNTSTPEALFIMMNPGKSEPKKKTYQPPLVNETELVTRQQIDIKLVETKPDTTQYQVMRVMKEKNWQHVRVINLSDYREKDSDKFYDKLEELKQYDKQLLHSIFSSKRSVELRNLISQQKNLRFVSAWGVSTNLDDLISLAIKNKKLKNRIGNKKCEDEFYYYHPLRRDQPRIAWVEDLLKKL